MEKEQSVVDILNSNIEPSCSDSNNSLPAWNLDLDSILPEHIHSFIDSTYNNYCDLALQQNTQENTEQVTNVSNLHQIPQTVEQTAVQDWQVNDVMTQKTKENTYQITTNESAPGRVASLDPVYHCRLNMSIIFDSYTTTILPQIDFIIPANGIDNTVVYNYIIQIATTAIRSNQVGYIDKNWETASTNISLLLGNTSSIPLLYSRALRCMKTSLSQYTSRYYINNFNLEMFLTQSPYYSVECLHHLLGMKCHLQCRFKHTTRFFGHAFDYVTEIQIPQIKFLNNSILIQDTPNSPNDGRDTPGDTGRGKQTHHRNRFAKQCIRHRHHL